MMNTATDQFARASIACDCQGETLWLHPERCLYWPARRTLLVADIHFGKEHSFGRAGIAIPGGISEHDLRRLSALIDGSGAENLIILGDFMHAAPARNEPWLLALSHFLDDHSDLDIQIVAGNHDKPRARLRVDERIRWQAESLVQHPFVLQHHPASDKRGYVLCGHLHPVYRVSTGRLPGLRAPAFWFRDNHAVLPAFGGFTGGMAVSPESGDRLYVAGPECVVHVPWKPRTSARRRRR